MKNQKTNRRPSTERNPYFPKGGYVRVYREQLFHAAHLHPWRRGEKANKGFAWIDLLGLAEWQDVQKLKRGQLRASDKFLANRWNWSISKVRKFLEELHEKGLIDRDSQGGRQPSIITIIRYDIYNGEVSADEQDDAWTAKHQDEKGKLRTENTQEENNNQSNDPGGSTLALDYDDLTYPTTPSVVNSPITHRTYAGLFRKLSGDALPEDGMGNEIFRLREMELEPLDACAILVAQWWQKANGEMPHDGLIGTTGSESSYELQPLIELGQSLLGSPNTALEVYSTVDDLMSDLS